jgi:S23 ribosomal protein.
MATIKRFEDINVWKEARELYKLIFTLTCKEQFSHDFRLVGQIRSSSGSIMDNIAEGFEREGNKEFCQFLYISKGSCGELKSQLYRALDSDYIESSEFDCSFSKADEVSKLLSSFIKYLKTSEIKGQKYKPTNEGD